MKTFCVANEKGGVGKTTLCAYLAWHFAGEGKRVLAIDLDQQSNLSYTLDGFDAGIISPELFIPGTEVRPIGPLTVVKSDPEALEIEQTRDDLVPIAFRDNVRAASDHFDFCIIDTPPSLGVRAIAAIIAADYSASPIDMGDYSLLGIQRFLDFQARVAAHYGIEQPKFMGIVPSRYDRKSPRERALYEQLMGEANYIPIFPLYLTKRDAYARSASERVPAWKMQGTASREAAAEIRAVMGEFAKRLEFT